MAQGEKRQKRNYRDTYVSGSGQTQLGDIITNTYFLGKHDGEDGDCEQSFEAR